MNDAPTRGSAVPSDALSGRRALITGGASGIGAACSRMFAAAGAHVTVCDLNGDAAQQLAEEIRGEAWVADLADTEALDEVSLDTDILINNAGIQHVSPLQEFDPQKWRFMHRLMVESPFLLIRAVLPGMYSRGFGRIINLSSAHGMRASPYKSAYVAAKHALEGLSKVTALEGAEHGVTSNCLNPSYVRTPLVEKQIADQARIHDISEDEVVEKIMLTESAVKRLVEADEVASLALWMASDASGMVTGTSFAIDGGWTAA